MTVGELIEMLQECDAEAEVRIMSQEHWPFENAIAGLAVRDEITREGCECDHRFTEPHEHASMPNLARTSRRLNCKPRPSEVDSSRRFRHELASEPARCKHPKRNER